MLRSCMFLAAASVAAADYSDFTPSLDVYQSIGCAGSPTASYTSGAFHNPFLKQTVYAYTFASIAPSCVNSLSGCRMACLCGWPMSYLVSCSTPRSAAFFRIVGGFDVHGVALTLGTCIYDSMLSVICRVQPREPHSQPLRSDRRLQLRQPTTWYHILHGRRVHDACCLTAPFIIHHHSMH
jgi:hypothetical protein